MLARTYQISSRCRLSNAFSVYKYQIEWYSPLCRLPDDDTLNNDLIDLINTLSKIERGQNQLVHHVKLAVYRMKDVH